MGNNLEKGRQNSRMIDFVKTDDLLKDMCGIIESSRDAAYRLGIQLWCRGTGSWANVLPVKKCREKREQNFSAFRRI